MLLVGIENCKPCIEIHEKHPEIPFVMVPIHAANSNKDVYEVKKALGRLGVKGFPVLLNDSMTEQLPLTYIDPKYKGYGPKVKESK